VSSKLHEYRYLSTPPQLPRRRRRSAFANFLLDNFWPRVDTFGILSRLSALRHLPSSCSFLPLRLCATLRATSPLPQVSVFSNCVWRDHCCPFDLDSRGSLPPRVFPYPRRRVVPWFARRSRPLDSTSRRHVPRGGLGLYTTAIRYKKMGDEEKSRVSGESPRATQNAPVLPTVAPSAEKSQPASQSSIHPAVYVL